MIPIRVIGVGSPIGLDRIGWEAVRGLENRGLLRYLPPGRVELSVLDRPGSLLVQVLESAPAVILVDAMQAGGRPGKVRRFTPPNLPPEGAFVSSHDVGVTQAIALAGALGVLPSRLVIYGIEIGPQPRCTAAARLAELCERAVARLYPRVAADIARWRNA